MAVISKGQTFAAGDQVTASKLNNLADNATFASGAVDNVSTQLSGGAIIVRDGGITPAKLSAGAPSWQSDGRITGSAFRAAQGAPNNGDSSTTGYAFGDDGDSGMFSLGTTGDSGGPLAFYQNSAERMRLSNGALLIGTENLSPWGNTGNNTGIALHSSDSAQRGLITSSRNENLAAAFNRTGSNGDIVGFYREGAIKGSVSVTATQVSYNTTSDYRLKEDIVEMEGSLDRLKSLKPCNFAWKSDGTRVDGFIAHEAQEVVPEAVIGTKDAVDAEGKPKYQGIDQAKLVPLLTKALQEAVAKIEALEARVAALES